MAGQPVAVVGMGVVLPGISSPDDLWRVLCGDRNILTEPSADRMDLRHFWSADPDGADKSRHRYGGFIEQFVPHPELMADIRSGAWSAAEDPPATWLRHCALQTLQGLELGAHDRVLLEVAVAVDTLQALESRMVGHGLSRMLGDALELGDDSGRAKCLRIRQILSRRYGSDLDGHLPDDICRRAFAGLLPPLRELDIVTATCGSALTAINLAVQRLRAGACDIAICGAAHELTPRAMVALSNAGVLGDIPEIRALDQDAHGTAFGDGAALVALETLDRARAAGHRVLAVITGSGAASDGRGRSPGAPNPRGQQLAITRAWEAAGIGADDLDVVVTHGTGTRAGDPVEVEVLRQMVTDRSAPLPVVSNKSLVSHTGICAGMVSILHGILALRHETIPAQQYFTSADRDLGGLVVPTTPTPWPARADRPRVAALSAFGLGGVNTHLILSDGPTGHLDRPAADPNPIVLAGWSGRFPGDIDRSAVEQWLTGAGAPPPKSFGDTFPLPGFTELRIPPVAVEHMDRTEILALRSVAELIDQLGMRWEELRGTTGVVVAHAGHMRAAVLSAQRCYLEDCADAIGAQYDTELQAAVDAVAATLHAQVPAMAQDTAVTTVGASLIGGWVTNYFNLQGPHLAVENTDNAGLSAVRIAEYYLRHGGMDLMFVIGVNANSEPELAAALPAHLRAQADVAEGAVAIALARRDVTDKLAVPVLATVCTQMESAVENAGSARIGNRTYVGADGLLAILRAVAAGESARINASRSDCPTVIVDIAAPVESTGSGAGINHSRTSEDSGDGGIAGGDAGIPSRDRDADSTAPGTPELIVTRTRLEFGALAEAAADCTPVVALTPTTLVVTDDPVLARALGKRVPCTIWVVGQELPDLTAPVEHVRVLSRLHASNRLDPWSGGTIEKLCALHDLTFTALQRCASELVAGASFAVLLMDAVWNRLPHPSTGLFSGLMKTVAVEFPQARCWCVCTDTPDLDDALDQLAAESALEHHLGLVLRSGQHRLGYVLTALDTAADDGVSLASGLLTDHSVVVATGGAGGVMGPLLTSLARDHKPVVYILGRTAAPGPDFHAPAPDRAGYITEQLRQCSRLSPKTLAAQWESARKQQAISDLITDVAEHSGRARVHYLACDITDEAAVRKAIDHIHHAEGGIDLLIHAASGAAPAAITRKDISAFRRGRDTKVAGYVNLRRALEGRRPRLWFNFGSVIGFVGWPAEADYASANDFLSTSAMWNARIDNTAEVTVNWTAWDGLGLTGDPVVQDTMRGLGITEFMSADEAYLRLRQAIDNPDRPPVIVHLPRSERDVVAAQAPRLQIGPESVPVPEFVFPDDSHVYFEYTYDTAKESYLAAHIVRGRPLMPGSVPMELALEAALRLAPGLRPTGFRDLELHVPLRATANRPKTVRVSATIIERGDDHARIRCWITSDIRHPGDGRVLDKRLHSELDVLLARDLSVPAPWTRPNPMPARSVPNPIYLPNDLCHVFGPYVTTTGHAADAAGAHSTFAADSGTAPGFATFGRVPTILLQGVLELAVLAGTGQERIPMVLIHRIAEIDLYTPHNDATVLAAHGSQLEFFAEPPHRGGGLLAIADGALLLRAAGVETADLGHYDLTTRQFHDYAGTVAADTTESGPSFVHG